MKGSNKIYLDSFGGKLSKIILSFSMFFLIIILSNYDVYFDNSIIYVLLSSLEGAFLFNILLFSKKEFIFNKKVLVISFLISTYALKWFLDLKYMKFDFILKSLKFNSITNIVVFSIGILALPACLFISYLFMDMVFPKVKSFLKKLDKIEKKYLLIVGVVSTILTIIICSMTIAFTSLSDVIYTSDSGILASQDAFVNFSHPENDIRQPLFGVFALPFGLIAHFLSNFFFMQKRICYQVIMIIIQFLLNAISTIMLCRLLKLDDKYKKYFYLLFSISFPYLIFGFILEQYSIALFYLILSIYISFVYKGINYSYIAATGTLLTSGIVFPLITKFKTLKQWFKDMFNCAFSFLVVLIFSGQSIQLLTLKYKMVSLSTFYGNVSFEDKIFRFSNFISSIFIGTNGSVVNVEGNLAYRLVEPSGINYVGLCIFGLLIISFILNRKERMAKISFLWVLFSILVLVLIGWGQPENGLILYGLYFAWAYLILYFMFWKKILKNIKLFKIVMSFSIILMLIFNVIELLKILSFAIKVY